MSTMTTLSQGQMPARARRAVGGVCSASGGMVAGSSWRRVSVAPVLHGFGTTRVGEFTSHHTTGTTNPAGDMGYPSIKRPARHLGTRST